MDKFCVTCGQLLTPENAHGLICQECFGKDRQAYVDKKHPKLIEVKFCGVCGLAFVPVASEIMHSMCL